MASAALKKPVFLKVDQLKPGGTGLNLVVKCVSCNIVVDRQRPDGSRIRIAECVVADETGCITLSARNGTCMHFRTFNLLYIISVILFVHSCLWYGT